MELNPRLLLGIGFILLVIGVALPLLMVMQAIQSTFFLNFLAFGASTLGIMLGILGVLTLVVRNRHDDRNRYK